MTRSIIGMEESGSPEGFTELLTHISTQEGVAGLFVMACEGNPLTVDEINSALQSVSKPLFGGIFPRLIHEDRQLTRGSIVVGLPVEPEIRVVPELSNERVDFEPSLLEWSAAQEGSKTMFVWVDGLASRISDLLDAIFLVYGPVHHYIGGGAGSLSLVQQPCIFTNQGVLQDSAVLAILDVPSSLGVSHGWTHISGPYKVTASTRNVVKTINWQPAFDVYRSVVEPLIGQPLTAENFFDHAKSYPLGIARLGAERIVRDPIRVGEDGSLICVGEVLAESHIDILHGDRGTLIHAAQQAALISRRSFPGADESPFTFVADCISRVLFLGDEFEHELQAISQGNSMVGALTLGEIANNGRSYLEFYNKTVVVGLLEI